MIYKHRETTFLLSERMGVSVQRFAEFHIIVQNTMLALLVFVFLTVETLFPALPLNNVASMAKTILLFIIIK